MLPMDALQMPSLVVPHETLIQEFSHVAETHQSEFEANEIESLTLAKLRDTLLPQLLSGELRIPDAEKLLAGSL